MRLCCRAPTRDPQFLSQVDISWFTIAAASSPLRLMSRIRRKDTKETRCVDPTSVRVQCDSSKHTRQSLHPTGNEAKFGAVRIYAAATTSAPPPAEYCNARDVCQRSPPLKTRNASFASPSRLLVFGRRWAATSARIPVATKGCCKCWKSTFPLERAGRVCSFLCLR